MESALKSLWFLVASPPAVPANLSGISTETLNSLKEALGPFRDADLSLLLWATILVTVGVLMEVAEIQHDVRDAVRRLKGRCGLGELNSWWKLIVALGWMLVACGLCLEWVGDARVNSVDADLDRVNQVILKRAQKDANTAEQAAINAQGASCIAQKKADAAGVDAGKANASALLAQAHATEIGSELATEVIREQAAEQRLEDEKVKRLKLAASMRPRGIDDDTGAIKMLASTKPVPVFISYLNEHEPRETAEQIAYLLNRLGWPVWGLSYDTGAEISGIAIDSGIRNSMLPLPQMSNWRWRVEDAKKELRSTLNNSGLKIAESGTCEANLHFPQTVIVICVGPQDTAEIDEAVRELGEELSPTPISRPGMSRYTESRGRMPIPNRPPAGIPGLASTP